MIMEKYQCFKDDHERNTIDNYAYIFYVANLVNFEHTIKYSTGFLSGIQQSP